MKRGNLILFALIALTIVSCCKDRVTGSGDLVTESFTVPTFTKLSSEGVFEVTVTQGDSQSVEITADDNVIEHVIVEVVNGELRLDLEDKNYRSITLEATIQVQNITRIENIGSGNIDAIDMDTESLTLENVGSGNISVAGTATNLTFVNEGSGNLYAFDCLSSDCEITIEGSGNCEVTCSDNLDVLIEGSGNVYYKGYPTITSQILGSGNIIDAN